MVSVSDEMLIVTHNHQAFAQILHGVNDRIDTECFQKDGSMKTRLSYRQASWYAIATKYDCSHLHVQVVDRFIHNYNLRLPIEAIDANATRHFCPPDTL